jgi:triosephosphate isomerase
MSKLIIANWKSNKNTHEVGEWLLEFHQEFQSVFALGKSEYDVVICPAYPFVMQVGAWIRNSPFSQQVSLGVQDMSPFAAGSYTGEVSGPNLTGLDVKYAIVGHSERRKHLNESSLDVSKKVESCLEERITPIVCVDRIEIEQQAHFIDRKHYEQIVVAYEPVEHIGTGIAQDVNEVLNAMKEVRAAFPKAKVIYGGSLNPENITLYSGQAEIEGFLVGNASLKADQFVEMISG